MEIVEIIVDCYKWSMHMEAFYSAHAVTVVLYWLCFHLFGRFIVNFLILLISCHVLLWQRKFHKW